MTVLSICLSTADKCQTNCRAKPPREPVVLEWSQHGRELVIVVSILSSLLTCPFVIEHSELFHPFPKNCTRELSSLIKPPPHRRPLSLTYIIGVLVLLFKQKDLFTTAL